MSTTPRPQRRVHESNPRLTAAMLLFAVLFQAFVTWQVAGVWLAAGALVASYGAMQLGYLVATNGGAPPLRPSDPE